MLPCKQRSMITLESRSNIDDFTTFTEPLAKHGPPAIFAIPIPTGPGNDISVFRQDQGRDLLILRASARDWQLLNSRHSGFRDILLKAYMGIDHMVSIWRYDGHRYRVATCTDHNEADGSATAAPLDFCADSPDR